MSTNTSATRYRWQDLVEDHPMELLARRRIIGEKAMLSDVVLQQGCEVPMHAHANEQFAIVLSGRLRFGIDDGGERREIVVQAGEVLHLPPNVPHSARAEQESRVLDVFCPPSDKTGIDRA